VRPSSNFTILGWVLFVVMVLYVALITIPSARADEPTPRAKLILEIRDEKLRIFEYETSRLLCHVSIVDVKMIGSQVSVTCVRKDEHRHTKPIRVRPPLR